MKNVVNKFDLDDTSSCRNVINNMSALIMAAMWRIECKKGATAKHGDDIALWENWTKFRTRFQYKTPV